MEYELSTNYILLSSTMRCIHVRLQLQEKKKIESQTFISHLQTPEMKQKE